jgi:Succinylglutamate desuccinylase / Aspartoacylase family
MEPIYTRFEGYEELKPLLDTSDEEVLLRLGKPTLIRIPSADPAPPRPLRARFVSCLLHGNEDSGYRAVLELLRTGARFPFDLWVFIGNVAAASRDGWFAHRFLDGQEDFNRVWGTSHPSTRMRQIADEVVAELDRCELEAVIDLHNNTGKNPYYAIMAQKTDATFALAATCADTIVEWGLRAHSLIEQFSTRCPTAAVECGIAGRKENTAFAAGVLHRFLTAPSFEPSAPRSPALFQMRYRVTVRRDVAFTFANELTDGLDLVLLPSLDGHNFGMMLAETALGHVHPSLPMPLAAIDMAGNDATERLFAVRPGGRLVVTEDVTPLMMTRSALQAQRDCLFYIARQRAWRAPPPADPPLPVCGSRSTVGAQRGITPARRTVSARGIRYRLGSKPG